MTKQELSSMREGDIMQRICELQDVQKCNRMDSTAWQDASMELAPLFTEMARRQKARLLVAQAGIRV